MSRRSSNFGFSFVKKEHGKTGPQEIETGKRRLKAFLEELEE